MKNVRFEEVLKSRLIPLPKEIIFEEGECVIRDGLPVTVQTPDADPALPDLLSGLFRRFWNVSPQIRIEIQTVRRGPEAYEIRIAPDQLTLCGDDIHALRYALQTLRQLAEPERGMARFRNYVLQPGVIRDRPGLAFRGIHICIFPETPMWFVEKQIRLAAAVKFNYAVIESWGVFPFRSHPEFCWRDKEKSHAEFARILDVAEECGITLIPQFNIFGHAAMSRVGTAKHAVLSVHKELQSLFEPGGWTFCLTNPETRKVLTDLVLELYEMFRCPPYFHIGCDESYDFQTCRACAEREPVSLLTEHIVYFQNLLKERNARVMMWHDMLFSKAEPEFRGCTAHGNADTVRLRDSLPRDILLADWEYHTAPSPEHEWPSVLFLQEKGFDVLTCPWLDDTGMRELGDMAVRRKMFGFLETTWNMNSGHAFPRMFHLASDCAWNGNGGKFTKYSLALASQIRYVDYDMGLTVYEQTGHTALQIREKPDQGE